MTHFASAADYVGGQTEGQCATFEAWAAALPLRPRYCTWRARSRWRTGAGVRVNAGEEAPRNLLVAVRPALAWKATRLAAKEVPEGATVDYRAMFRAPRPMRVGIVAAGYADGIPHRLSNRGRFIAGGQWAAVSERCRWM